MTLLLRVMELLLKDHEKSAFLDQLWRAENFFLLIDGDHRCTAVLSYRSRKSARHIDGSIPGKYRRLHSFSCNGEAGVRAPEINGPLLRQLPSLAARGLIKVYQYTLSPLLGPRCRHLPSCSSYADEAVHRFGFWAGGWMTLARLLRCQPWGTSGLDFVPRQLRGDAHWWTPWRYGLWRGTNATPPGDA